MIGITGFMFKKVFYNTYFLEHKKMLKYFGGKKIEMLIDKHENVNDFVQLQFSFHHIVILIFKVNPAFASNLRHYSIKRFCDKCSQSSDSAQ